ncbi:hypothetical protein [Desertihabitans brevis]|uniref:hypothetical protein n=1 Tax=Desertihabitans brevis TaxID=2268447 RepID=UPI001314D274|nr:hypothetical protein [Desertihabitans brevis]
MEISEKEYRRILLHESAPAVETSRAIVAEAGVSLVREASQPDNGARRYSARILEADVWGSSGHYPTRTLSEAAKSRVFAAGIPVYLDHPGSTEAMDRPERSVRDMAGKLVTDAVMESDGLHAEIEFYPHMAPVVEAMAGDVGLSIRAFAEAEPGEAAGRKGMLITRITEALSVDVVTKAGAGGKLISLLESARGGTLTRETATDDERDSLTRVLPRRAWLRDFDPAARLVWFTRYDEPDDRSRTWQQAYTLTDGVATLTGSPVEVRVITTYQPITDPSSTPASEAGAPTTPASSAGANPQEHTMEITEADYATLTERANRADQLAAELAQLNARQAAEQRAVTPLAEANLPDTLSRRALAEALRDLKLTEAGVLDEEAFDTRLTETIKAETDLLAEITPDRKVTGFGAAESAPTSSSQPQVNPWGRQIKEA